MYQEGSCAKLHNSTGTVTLCNWSQEQIAPNYKSFLYWGSHDLLTIQRRQRDVYRSITSLTVSSSSCLRPKNMQNPHLKDSLRVDTSTTGLQLTLSESEEGGLVIKVVREPSSTWQSEVVFHRSLLLSSVAVTPRNIWASSLKDSKKSVTWRTACDWLFLQAALPKY